MALVGWNGQIDAGELIRKGLTVHGAWHWNLGDAPRLMQTIRESGPQIDRFLTHRFPLAQVQDAWELQLTGHCGKVLLYPWA